VCLGIVETWLIGNAVLPDCCLKSESVGRHGAVDDSLTFAGIRSGAFGVLRMDMMSIVSSLLGAQAGNVRTQIAATILKSNAETEKSTVLTLLGAAQQDTSSLANVGAGIGGNLNITA
jgi:hypothetical protein